MLMIKYFFINNFVSEEFDSYTMVFHLKIWKICGEKNDKHF